MSFFEEWIHTQGRDKACIHRCFKCGRMFDSDRNLYIHSQTHSENTYQCEQCDQSFTEMAYITQHLRYHEVRLPYRCEWCEKEFSQSSIFQIHLRIHTGEKPYICQWCGKEFSQSGNLKIHLRIHTGEKPFRCERCGKEFSQSGNLKSHLRIHTGEKPYRCEWCGKQFGQLNSLRYHSKIHTGEKAYKCEMCGIEFRSSSHYRRHLRTQHSEKINIQTCNESIASPATSTQTLLKKFICRHCKVEFSNLETILSHVTSCRSIMHIPDWESTVKTFVSNVTLDTSFKY